MKKKNARRIKYQLDKITYRLPDNRAKERSRLDHRFFKIVCTNEKKK